MPVESKTEAAEELLTGAINDLGPNRLRPTAAGCPDAHAAGERHGAKTVETTVPVEGNPSSISDGDGERSGDLANRAGPSCKISCASVLLEGSAGEPAAESPTAESRIHLNLFEPGGSEHSVF